jgi:hypothetical protein
MPDLAELVRDEFHAQATTIETPAELDDRTHDRIGRRVQRRRALAGGGLAALALAVVAAAVALPDGRSTVVTSPSQAGDDPLYVVPGWLPDGFRLTAAGGLAEDLPPPRDVADEGSEVYICFDPSGQHAEATLKLEWGFDPGGSDVLGDPVEVGDRTGLVSDGVLTWQDHERLMRLSGTLYTETGPEPVPVETLTAAAATVELGGAGQPVITEPPEGFEGTGAMPDGPSEGVGERWATYEDGTGRRLTVEVADAAEIPPLSLVDGTLTRRVEVRGHEGALLFGEPPATPGPSHDGHLAWEERPRTQVRVTTQGLEEADILRVAEELRTVDEGTWKSDVLGMENGTTTTSEATDTTGTTAATGTTTSTTTATAEPAPTSKPAPGGTGGSSGADVTVLPLTGTYSGTEHYTLGSEECPELDHVYDATITEASGAEWAFHEDYCGRIDADDMWSGEGTFTITSPGGDELTGTFNSEAPADGDGAPYTLTVTGGSGRYEGASGECTADNHVERVSLGTQLQSGDIICTIGLPGRPPP